MIFQNKKGIPHEVVHKMVHDDISLLSSWRQHLSFTQKEIAEKLSITQAALSQIEDVNSKPRKKTLQKFAFITKLD